MTLTSTEGLSQGGGTGNRPKGRRRPSHPAETARRRAWGREWGAVGAEYKRKRLLRER